jgi:hypothetical protein
MQEREREKKALNMIRLLLMTNDRMEVWLSKDNKIILNREHLFLLNLETIEYFNFNEIIRLVW